MPIRNKGEIMKKRILSLVLSASMLGVMFAATGCGSDVASENGKLYVYNWGEYIDEEVIDEFEEETGIKVIYDTFESNEIMYAKLAQDSSAYDVICPSDYLIQKLIQNDLIQELDFSAIPNSVNIGEQYYEYTDV